MKVDFCLLCGICPLLCCTRCRPSKMINEMAFLPPHPATYTITTYVADQDEMGEIQYVLKLHLTRTKFFSRNVFFTTTSLGNQIVCVMIKQAQANFTILYSHVNATDIGQVFDVMKKLSHCLQCNIFLYDYSGYGASTGKPSEVNVCADIEAAHAVLRDQYHIPDSHIILYGQSIGSVPTVHLASKIHPAGVILHSALLSALRVVFPSFKTKLWCDGLRNIDKLEKITSPVLVIHGMKDQIVDFSHGLSIFKHCPQTVKPLWVKDAGHNNIEMFKEYLQRLRVFLEEELPKSRGCKRGNVPTHRKNGKHAILHV